MRELVAAIVEPGHDGLSGHLTATNLQIAARRLIYPCLTPREFQNYRFMDFAFSIMQRLSTANDIDGQAQRL